MADIRIDIGGLEFTARWESKAPVSCAWLLEKLPFAGTVLQARWSGEAGWCRLGPNLHLDPENATSQPAPGQILLYAGDVSEPELLIPYGKCAFAYHGGPLRGNHIATLGHAAHELRTLGEQLQLRGAQSLRITRR